jgi:hypothetical protein
MTEREEQSGGARESISIGDALRAVGFGETSIAEKFKELVGNLYGKTNEAKVLLETLKECGKYLEASRARARAAAESDGEPVSVELVHNVGRPARERNRGGQQQIGFQFEKETL